MTQPKPATKPKAQVREVFEIKPLEWVDFDRPHLISLAESALGQIVIKINDDDDEIVSVCGIKLLEWSEFESPDEAKAAAEQWYRQQLGKALRRVK